MESKKNKRKLHGETDIKPVHFKTGGWNRSTSLGPCKTNPPQPLGKHPRVTPVWHIQKLGKRECASASNIRVWECGWYLVIISIFWIGHIDRIHHKNGGKSERMDWNDKGRSTTGVWGHRPRDTHDGEVVEEESYFTKTIQPHGDPTVVSSSAGLGIPT